MAFTPTVEHLAVMQEENDELKNKLKHEKIEKRNVMQRIAAKFGGHGKKVVNTVEVAAGALAGGVIEGKMGPGGATVGHVPINLIAGVGLNAVGHALTYSNKESAAYSDHLCRLGDGFLAAFVSGVGFNLGKNWHDHAMGGHAAQGLPPGDGPKVAGHIPPEVMAEIAQRMRQNP